MIRLLAIFLFIVITFLCPAQEVFFDDFTNGNQNGWQTGEEPGVVIRTIEDGSFRIESLKSGSYPYTVIPVDIDLTKNFEISIAINYQSVDIQAAGLLFGYLDEKNFLSFVTSKNGFFRFSVKDKNVWSDVKTWKKTEAADQDDPLYNKLSVIRQGSHFIFRVNDVTVHQTGVIDFFGNRFGFVVNNEQTASFDFMKIRYLDSDENYLPDKTLVVRDEFNDNQNNWAMNDSYPAIFKIEGGKYHLELLAADQSYQSSQSLKIDYNRDFEINVRMIKSGGSKEDSYGLIFGMKGIENLYFFQVTGDRLYAIGKVENSDYSYFVESSESKNIHLLSTNQCYNELSLARKGGRLYYYVNDEELYNQAFPTLFGNDFGFMLKGKQTIQVDYLEVNYLD
jgi:hypothetical protein